MTNAFKGHYFKGCHFMSTPRFGGWVAVLCSVLLAGVVRADSIVVFNEIMYHPTGDETNLEWVEFHNQMGVDVDISGWSLANGIFFTFPTGTIVPGGDYIVVASNPAVLAATTGFSGALGPFTGRLDNSGERLELRNNSFRLMDSVRYRDEDGWPIAADGSGLTLAKFDKDSVSERSENWSQSAEMGGTPGAVNFNVSNGGGGDLPSGLVSYWPCDGSGSTVRDDAGSNDGTLGSGVSRVAGLVGGGALDFDNTANAFVNLGSGGGSFSTTDGITVEAVIAPDWSGTAGDYDQIFRKEDGSSRILFGFQHDANTGTRDVPISPAEQPVLSFGINVGGVYSELDMPLDGQGSRPTLAELKDGSPHHVAATYDRTSGQKRIYIDGVLAFSATLSGSISSGGASTAYIGNMSGRGEPNNGVLDEVAFWSRALSSTDIAAHSAAALSGLDYFSSPESGSVAVAVNEAFTDGLQESWIELVNYGVAATQLENFVLISSGLTEDEYVFPNLSIAAGGYLLLDETTLGFALTAGNKLFLLTPSRSQVVEALELKPGLRGLHPEGVGELLWPDVETPGAANSFTFHDEIVINEIMYHPRPLEAVPPTIEESTIVPVGATWRFDDSGDGYATSAWRLLSFNDDSWGEGAALLYVENADLPAPKNTPLTLGATTFYFRTTFEFSGDPASANLNVRPIIDDGAVIYLNGAEVLRVNMPTGAITPSTFALTGVSDATFQGPFAIPSDALINGTNVLAVEVHQATANSSDVVMGVELFGSTVVDPGRPFAAPPRAYVELYNRGASTIDLSGWSLDDGINYTFPGGTLLAADEYIVVAEDAAVLADAYPTARIVGNYTGRLSHRNDRLVLRDAARNPADVVEYYDGGRWPEFADGGGSSLELRDPDADNGSADAWAPSDESSRTSWRTYTYDEVATANIGPTQWNEFIFGLLDDGEILIDDVSVIESPGGGGVQFISNRTFSSTSSWRIIGNHRHSTIVPDPDNAGNSVLHLVATGSTEHMHNHAETTLANGETTVNGRTYRVSFRARWVTGSNQLHTRLYFNRVPQTTLIDVPEVNGTPGEPNSTLVSNVGPTYEEFGHSPAVPGSGEATTVSVRAVDPDGVDALTVWYSVEGGAWQSRSMSHQGDGLYEGTIPGQSSARTVQFYVEGDDDLGATSTYPAGGRDSRALYRVEDGRSDFSNKHNLRIVMTPDDIDFLHTAVQVMSNDRIGCTVIYNESEVFYECGVRLKGSERGRNQPGRVGFNIRFPRDHMFRGVHRGVAVDRSGGFATGTNNGQDEILVKHVISHAGGLPGQYNDLIRVIAPRSAQDGPALLAMERTGTVLLDSYYLNGGEGTVFEFELIYYPRTTGAGGLKLPEPDSVIGVEIQNHGDDKEVYRWNFTPTNNRDKDDFAGLIALCKTMSLSGSSLEAAAPSVMNVDEWMRAFAAQSLCGIGDAYGAGLPHNLRIYSRPDGITEAIPWDWDFAFVQSTTAGLRPGGNIRKVVDRPPYLHLYYGHLHDIIQSTYNTSYMGHWTSHYGTLAGRSYSQFLSYIGSRRSHVLANLPSNVAFSITTNSGQAFTVDTPTVELEGNGWINVRTVGVAGVTQSLTTEWTGLTTWSLGEVPLTPGVNNLTLVAFNLDGDILASDTIAVTTTFVPPEPTLTSVDPAAALVGDTVSVFGQDLLSGVEVRFDGTLASSTAVINSTRVDVVVPALSPGPVDVTAQNVGSDPSNAVPFTVVSSPEVFIRGDFNLDGIIDISDPLRLVFHLFHELPSTCRDAGDANNDEVLNLTDTTVLLNYIFLHGTPPPAPFPNPGNDPDEVATLECEGGL